MNSLKEKYQYIKTHIKDYLNLNQENYFKLYEEWKQKSNKNIALKGYDLRDLLNDLKKLIPIK